MDKFDEEIKIMLDQVTDNEVGAFINKGEMLNSNNNR